MAKPARELHLLIHSDADPYLQALEVVRLRGVLRAARLAEHPPPGQGTADGSESDAEGDAAGQEAPAPPDKTKEEAQ
jgi:hypothetical protein